MSQKKGLGERVVKDLIREIWGENHHVYCDNYFTSTDLFQELLENGTYACGTIRTNRKGLPPAVSKAKLRRQGEMVQQQNHSMVATAWHDKRTITLLSTNADPREMTEVQRKQKDGSIVNVRCPKILKLYTQNMNGVDRADQLRSTYSICRKAAKWWKHLFWFMVYGGRCNMQCIHSNEGIPQPHHHHQIRKEQRRGLSLNFVRNWPISFWEITGGRGNGSPLENTKHEDFLIGLLRWTKSDLVNSARKTRSGKRGFTDVSNVV